MREDFKKAYRAFRMLGNDPDWRCFDADTNGIRLAVLIAAGRSYVLRLSHQYV